MNSLDSPFYKEIFPLLTCACCGSPNIFYTEKNEITCNNVECYAFTHSYIFIGQQPLLIDFRRGLFKRENFINDSAGVVVHRKSGLITTLIKRFLWGDSPVSAKQIENLIKRLAATGKSCNLLVVGGGTIGLGTEKLYKTAGINIISFDVYLSANTDFVADAHNIPLKNNSIDAVLVQAVLEHVLSPQKVVAEIYRVLKTGGLVYAETPFMQQVHEGAYDFTRYTESGHRWLFNQFDLIDSGAVRGVGVSLMWSIRFFFTGIFRSQLIGSIAAAAFFWLRFVERIVPKKANINGGSCFYFLGSKSTTLLAEKEIISFYDRG